MNYNENRKKTLEQLRKLEDEQIEKLKVLHKLSIRINRIRTEQRELQKQYARILIIVNESRKNKLRTSTGI